MAQINMPREQESGLDKIAKIVGIFKAGADTYASIAAEGDKSDERKLKQKILLDSQDPNSSTNIGLQASLKGTPLEGKTMYQLQQIGAQDVPGKLALSQAETAQKAGAPLPYEKFVEVASKNGPAQPGAPDSMAISYIGPDGKPAQGTVKNSRENELQATLKGLQIQNERTQVGKNNANAAFNNLDKPTQIQVEEIAKDIATKTAISNTIKSAFEILNDPDVSTDQKIVRGENIAKLLNSDQGKDAVGAEEAKRLLGLLQYKKFNLTEPGSMFGRDLGEFTKQVGLTSQQLDMALEKQNVRLNQLMSGNSQPAMTNIPKNISQSEPKAPKVSADDRAAMKWLSANPKDPDAAGVRATLKAKGLIP